MLEKFGYTAEDVYERIRQEIKRSSLFRFNWFIKSRTTAEISKRCQTLVQMIQRELDPSASYFRGKAGGVVAAATVMLDDEPKPKKKSRSKKALATSVANTTA